MQQQPRQGMRPAQPLLQGQASMVSNGRHFDLPLDLNGGLNASQLVFLLSSYFRSVTDFNHRFADSSTQNHNHESATTLAKSPSVPDVLPTNEAKRFENATASPSTPSSFNATGPFSFLSSEDKEKIKSIASKQNNISGDKFALLVAFVGKSTIESVDNSKEDTCQDCCKLRRGLECTKASMIKILSNRYPAQEFLEAFAEDLIEPITDRKMAQNPNCPTCQTAIDERNLARRLEKLVRNCYEKDQPYHAPSELVYRLRRKEQLRNSKVPVIAAELCVVEPPINAEPTAIVEQLASIEPTIKADQVPVVEQETVAVLRKRISELESLTDTLGKKATTLEATHSQELISRDVKIDDLTREMSRFEDESARKDEETSEAFRDLKQKLEEVQAQKEALRQEVIDSQTAYNQELAKKDSRIEELANQKAHHEEKSAKELEQVAEDFQDLKTQFEKLESRNATLQQDATDLEVGHSSLKDTVVHLEQKLELSESKEDEKELRRVHNELTLAKGEIITLKEHLEEVTLRVSILQAENETSKSESQEFKQQNTPLKLSESFAVVDSTEPAPKPVSNHSIVSIFTAASTNAGVQTTDPFWEVDEKLTIPNLEIPNNIDQSKSKASTMQEMILPAEEFYSQSPVLEVEHGDTFRTEDPINENAEELTPPPVQFLDPTAFKSQQPRLRWFWKLIIGLIVLFMIGIALYKFSPVLFKSISDILESIFSRTPLESGIPSESPAEILPTPTTIGETFQVTTTQSAETATPFAAPDVQVSKSMVPSLFDSPYKVAGLAVLGGTSVVGWHYRGEILNLFGF